MALVAVDLLDIGPLAVVERIGVFVASLGFRPLDEAIGGIDWGLAAVLRRIGFGKGRRTETPRLDYWIRRTVRLRRYWNGIERRIEVFATC